MLRRHIFNFRFQFSLLYENPGAEENLVSVTPGGLPLGTFLKTIAWVDTWVSDYQKGPDWGLKLNCCHIEILFI